MNIIKGNYGECRLIDNMDSEYGLPSLKDKSFDLCLTDYPYNVEYTGKKKGVTAYKDKMKFYQYLQFCYERFMELKRICKYLIIFPGNRNVSMWIEYIEAPTETLFQHKPFCVALSQSAYACMHDTMLCYGNRFLKQSVFTFSTVMQPTEHHSCPNNPDFYKRLISDVIHLRKIKSVLDPFLGSGTTAQVCEELGLNWIGYELNENDAGEPANYDEDIQLRIDTGIKFHKNKQQSILSYL